MKRALLVLGHGRGECDVAPQVALDAATSIGAHHQPQGQGAEGAAELNTVVHVIGRRVGVRAGRGADVGAQVLGHQAERRAQHLRAAGEQHAATHRREQPLVRVDDDRIGPFPAAEQRPQLRNDRGRAAVRGVHVQPQAVLEAEIGNRADRIDRGRGGRAGGGDDAEGKAALGPILGEAVSEGGREHPVTRVGRHQPDRLAAESQHQRRLLYRGVRLLGSVQA